MKENGFIAIDIIIPPSEKNWTIKQCKEWGKKKIYQTVEGELNLAKQTVYSTIRYETFKESLLQSTFIVEREYSLILQREIMYLLEHEGFEVVDFVKNYQHSVMSVNQELKNG